MVVQVQLVASHRFMRSTVISSGGESCTTHIPCMGQLRASSYAVHSMREQACLSHSGGHLEGGGSARRVVSASTESVAAVYDLSATRSQESHQEHRWSANIGMYTSWQTAARHSQVQIGKAKKGRPPSQSTIQHINSIVVLAACSYQPPDRHAHEHVALPASALRTQPPTLPTHTSLYSPTPTTPSTHLPTTPPAMRGKLCIQRWHALVRQHEASERV